MKSATVNARCDVAIIGYGPVGKVLAALLSDRGHSVIVIEKHQSVYPLPRAGHLDHEVMRILQSLGCADAASEACTVARRYELLAPDLTVLSRLPRTWAAPSGWDASYHFYQPDLETVLDRVVRRKGASVMSGREAVRITDLDDHVEIEVVDAAEAHTTIEARYLVGADGANSFTRSTLGIGWQDLGFKADWLVIDIALGDTTRPDVPDTGQVLDPARPHHMAILREDVLRWEFMMLPGDNLAEMQSAETIRRLLSPWLDSSEGTILRSTVYTFRSGIAQRWYDGHVALAGDAAHLMPPFLGQGMCSGVRDAATLAWMLDRILRGVSKGELLDAYQLSRSAHVLEYISESVRVGEMVCETDPVAAERIRTNLVAAPESRPMQPRIGPGVVRYEDPSAGLLSIQPVLHGEGKDVRLDDIVGQGFLLLTPRRGTIALTDASLNELDALEVELVDVADIAASRGLQADDGRLATWLKESNGVAVLVRPDRYVFGVLRDWDELDLLLEDLRNQLCVSL